MNKILILGGTNFIGRNLMESLVLNDDLELTIFNRGKTNPNLFPQITKIVGDRNTTDINLIFNSNWDYIIDLSCYYPNSLTQILKGINPSLKRYIFISTCSVYDNDSEKTILRGENSLLKSCSKMESVDTTLDTYGKRKVHCEKVLKQSGIRYSILRPALVYGQYDNTDRFYYWLYQIKMDHDLLMPNNGESLFSVTYVKDLVNAIIKTINTDLISDTYNITSNPKISISEIINTTSELLNQKYKAHNASSNFLKNNNISEWTDLPLWLDSDFFTFDNSKILKDLNLKISDFETSIKDTLSYFDKLGWKVPNYGLSEEVRMKLIDKLKKTMSYNK